MDDSAYFGLLLSTLFLFRIILSSMFFLFFVVLLTRWANSEM